MFFYHLRWTAYDKIFTMYAPDCYLLLHSFWSRISNARTINTSNAFLLCQLDQRNKTVKPFIQYSMNVFKESLIRHYTVKNHWSQLLHCCNSYCVVKSISCSDNNMQFKCALNIVVSVFFNYSQTSLTL